MLRPIHGASVQPLLLSAQLADVGTAPVPAPTCGIDASSTNSFEPAQPRFLLGELAAQ
jgi:hypothetical protein